MAGDGALDWAPPRRQPQVVRLSAAVGGILRWRAGLPEADPLIAAGAQAWASVRQSQRNCNDWEQWKRIGFALKRGRELADNPTKGFGRWLKTSPFADLERTTRVRLLYCLDHLDQAEQVRGNNAHHPNAVYRKIKRAQPRIRPLGYALARLIRTRHEALQAQVWVEAFLAAG